MRARDCRSARRRNARMRRRLARVESLGGRVRPVVRTMLLSWAIAWSFAAPAIAVSTAGQDPPRRDEFGVIPEDAVDKDLTLPDPVLDRTWPGPRPGDKIGPPQNIAPDEDETDPFADEIAPSPAPRAGSDESGEKPSRPARPPVGPDGKYDAGSPLPEADPDPPAIIEPEINEPSEIEEEDNRPSPLDRDDDAYDQESGDPGEW